MLNDQIKATGSLTITLVGPNKDIKRQITVPNIVVTAGKNLMASRLMGTSSNVMSHMAVGTSNVNLAAANTTLATELARVTLTSSVNTTNSVVYSATFGEGVGTGALVEAGILNSVTAGTLLCRTIFPVITKESNDVLTINWTVTIN